MGRFLAALLALVALLAAIVFLAPNLIPAKTYKSQIEAAATKSLGRQVSIGDDLSFKFLPEPSFAVRDLVIANEPGFEGDYLAKVERADIGVRLMPLFKKRVEISRFVLTRPDIVLQKSKSGAVNWNLAAPSGAQDGAGGEPADIRLGDVRFVDGRASYADAKENKTYSIDAFNATAKLSSLAEPLELAGAMNFQGAPSTIDLVLTNLSDILARRDSNLKIDAKIGKAAIGADLTLSGAAAGVFTGPVNLNAPDLPALASLFGVILADAPGFDTLAVSGKADGNAQSITLGAASIHFDAIEADGDIKLDWSGARPRATGSLTTDSLDMRPYMPPPTTSAQGFPAWSTAKIDFASLRNIDADLDINAGRVYLNELEAGETRMNLKVAGGKMTASIPQLGFYGGGGSGTLVVDATRATPSIAGKFAMNSVEAEPFTLALMKMDKLLGLGGFNLEFSATGASQAAIMQSLNGKGGFDLNDGAIKGVNIVKLASAAAKLYEGGLSNPAALTTAIAEAQRPTEKTDFSKFLSNFTITNGDVQAPTISLEGPFLTMTGVGRVDLPGQTLDLRLLPVASTAADNKSGRMVAIPVKIGGSFSKPTMAVDVESLVRGRAEQSLKGLLDKALAPKSGAGGAEGEAAPADPAADLLNGILGRPQKKPATTEGTAAEGATAPAAETRDAEAEDPAETLVNEGLNALFGRRKPAAETPPAEDDPN